MDEIEIHPLQKARKKLGIKQKTLADLTGLSETTIKRAERGDPLEDYTISAICEYFSKRYGRQIDRKELGLHAKWENTQTETLNQREETTQAANKHQTDETNHRAPFSQETLNIGGLTVNAIILSRGYYSPKELHCFYDDTPISLIPEFKRMKEELINDIEKRKTAGEMKLPYNSNMYKLKEFSTGYREIIENKEVPTLRLKFGPTDYFTQMVTDLNIGNPTRERYAKAISITETPVPEFATILGINLNLITKDGYIILTERSAQAHVAGSRLHTSVGENLLRPIDAESFNAPNPFHCASRGAKEELGISLNPDNIVFTSFTVVPDLCQYSLISTIQLQQTRREIEENWRFNVPSDKWENRQLLFYPHNPESLAPFIVSTQERWFNVALAAVILSLSDVYYPKKQIRSAFLNAQLKILE